MKYSALIVLVILSILVAIGLYILIDYQSNPSEERLELIKEFTDLCERNNGMYDNLGGRCYVSDGDFVKIYKFTRNSDGEELKLFVPYN